MESEKPSVDGVEHMKIRIILDRLSSRRAASNYFRRKAR